ncbi:hypothetical protein B1756_00275 [Natrarchaeobaculum aegyptiacum]|uniref:Uncharacterized protein n=1 Tax=Natrarchaeobaculum aegyptiacum TaxID=745377 RepID=A0A2Z2HTF8_9EURY|nr:hypothetical protein B1756_00275 [Natrarchaeobaculum aegyptiacum]
MEILEQVPPNRGTRDAPLETAILEVVALERIPPLESARCDSPRMYSRQGGPSAIMTDAETFLFTSLRGLRLVQFKSRRFRLHRSRVYSRQERGPGAI